MRQFGRFGYSLRRMSCVSRTTRALTAFVVVMLVFALSGCLGRALSTEQVLRHPPARNPGTPTVEHHPVRVTIVGDSLSEEYGPVFQRVGLEHGAVVDGRWVGGTNPVDHPWSTWVREWSGVDFVVLEDSYIPDGTHSASEYLKAWQDLVDAARTTLRPGGQVIVMKGNHPDLSSIRGIDRFVDQVTPDNPDGIHWTEQGYTAEATLLCEQLGRKGLC